MIENFIRELQQQPTKRELKILEFIQKKCRNHLEVYQGKVQDRQLCKTQACYVRGDYQGKEGSVYIEDFRKSSLKEK